jgi:predicted RNA-binding protein (virulence factor B family)
MAQIGQRNVLAIKYESSPGFFLDGGDLGEILLPGRYREEGMLPGTTVDVFVYRDSRDRLIATTEYPHAMVNEFAYLRVISVEQGLGAFLDWGLEKDLLMPIREFPGPVAAGDWVVVWVWIDERSNRLVASGRTNRHVDKTEAAYNRGDAVKLLISRITPLGYDAIINNAHSGLIYADDSAEPLGVGQSLDGYVLRMRPDGKVDLTLHQAGRERIGPLTEKILTALADSDGFLPLHDRSDPAEIQRALGVSKKAYKQAIGQLYRERKIKIEPKGIRFVSAE